MASGTRTSVTGSAYNGGTGTSLTVTTDATPQVGDLIVVVASSDGTDAAPPTLSGSGWATAGTNNTASDYGPATRVSTRAVTAAGAQSIAAVAPSNRDTGVFLYVWVLYGHDQAPAIAFRSSTSGSNTATALTAPTVTATGRGTRLSVVQTYWRSSGAPALTGPSGAATTLSPPIADSARGLGVSYPVTAAGTVGSVTVTSSAAVLSTGVTVVFPEAIRGGTGYAGVGLFARGSGTKVARAPVNARLGTSGRVTGSKLASGVGLARAGQAARANGTKIASGTGSATALGADADGSGRKLAHGEGQAARLGLRSASAGPPPVPIFTGRPLPEDPLPRASSRYLVQNILTGQWLHTDLPLSDDQVTLTLSGPCEIAGKITPEHVDLKAPDGSPLLRSWGHVIYLEMDGDIRAAGLITEDSYDDQTQSLSCQGVSAYPALTAYQGAYRRYFADPMDVVRDMWAYVQSFSNGNLGVAIARTAGTPATLYGAKVNLVPGDNIAGVLIASKDQNDQTEDQPIIPVRRANTVTTVFNSLVTMGFKNRARIDPAKDATGTNVPPSDCIFVTKAGLETAYSAYFMSAAASRTRAEPPDITSSFTIDPFKVDWWDVKTCGDLINDAVKACPADYVEQYTWNFPHTFVDQTVLLAYPRLGRRRDDLRFVQGENIVSDPVLDADPDRFATCVIGIGAGEGSESLRETAEVILPGRVRKTYVYRNSAITDRVTLRRLVADELAQRSVDGYEIASIVVQASHSNAQFGTYSVGDDIPVQVFVPHFGWLTQWCRILSMTLARGDDLVELKLRRSDSFFYGREIPSEAA